MLIVTEMSAGKVLDEACNQYNDAYSDEVLYTSRAGFPRVEARLPEVVVPAADLNGFMAHLYLSKG